MKLFGEVISHLVNVKLGDDLEYFPTSKSPYGHRVPGYGTPKPLVSPYGPHYSMHPELSRPAIGIITSTVTVPTLYVVAPVALAAANYAVIESAPEEEQRGLWMMFASALTGTFGGDYSGLI
ncbi:MAG: hypothetical protein [Circular genetic element sp.]|nr:MAG: hypothetical protein [Circular genetic element sp.]